MGKGRLLELQESPPASPKMTHSHRTIPTFLLCSVNLLNYPPVISPEMSCCWYACTAKPHIAILWVQVDVKKQLNGQVTHTTTQEDGAIGKKLSAPKCPPVFAISILPACWTQKQWHGIAWWQCPSYLSYGHASPSAVSIAAGSSSLLLLRKKLKQPDIACFCLKQSWQRVFLQYLIGRKERWGI